MLLAGASRRSRVRRVVLLAHTFGYAVLLGVVAWAGCRVEVFLSQPARLSAAARRPLYVCYLSCARVRRAGCASLALWSFLLERCKQGCALRLWRSRVKE